MNLLARKIILIVIIEKNVIKVIKELFKIDDRRNKLPPLRVIEVQNLLHSTFLK